MAGKIKFRRCPNCGKEYEAKGAIPFCISCEGRVFLEHIERDKKRITGNFTVVDWFSSRSSAGLVIEEKDSGLRVQVFMADLFHLFVGKTLDNITIEEIKKGSSYSWKVIKDDE